MYLGHASLWNKMKEVSNFPNVKREPILLVLICYDGRTMKILEIIISMIPILIGTFKIFSLVM